MKLPPTSEQRRDRKDTPWQAVVLWLNKEDVPGLSTLKLLSRKPKPRLVSVHLMALLTKLDNHMAHFRGQHKRG